MKKMLLRLFAVPGAMVFAGQLKRSMRWRKEAAEDLQEAQRIAAQIGEPILETPQEKEEE